MSSFAEHPDAKRQLLRGRLPQPLAEYLRINGKDRTSVIVDAADGWRYGSDDIDFSDPAVREQSYRLARESIDRIDKDELTTGELDFLEDLANKIDW